MRAGVTIEGLPQLVRGFERMGADLKKDVRAELRKGGDLVRDQARLNAAGRGLRKSGRLISGLRTIVRSGAVVLVRSTTKRKGFPYPAVYEYGRGGARNFLEPAVGEKADEVVEHLASMFDRLAAGSGGFH